VVLSPASNTQLGGGLAVGRVADLPLSDNVSRGPASPRGLEAVVAVFTILKRRTLASPVNPRVLLIRTEVLTATVRGRVMLWVRVDWRLFRALASCEFSFQIGTLLGCTTAQATDGAGTEREVISQHLSVPFLSQQGAETCVRSNGGGRTSRD